MRRLGPALWAVPFGNTVIDKPEPAAQPRTPNNPKPRTQEALGPALQAVPFGKPPRTPSSPMAKAAWQNTMQVVVISNNNPTHPSIVIAQRWVGEMGPNEGQMAEN